VLVGPAMSTAAARALITAPRARLVVTGVAAGRRNVGVTSSATARGGESCLGSLLPCKHPRGARRGGGPGVGSGPVGAWATGRRRRREDISASSAAAGMATTSAPEGEGGGERGAQPPPPSPVDPEDARFTTELQVLAVRAPRREMGPLMAQLRKHTIARPRLHKVVHLDGESHWGQGGKEGHAAESLILLDEESCSPTTLLADLPPQVARAVGLHLLSTKVAGKLTTTTPLITAVAAAAAVAAGGAGDTQEGLEGPTTTGIAAGVGVGGEGPRSGPAEQSKGTGSITTIASATTPQLVTHTIRMGYPELSVEEALRRILPADVTVPTGFETVGHIAHLNLRAEHEPHKGNP